MADIFISYSQEDREQARLLAAFLEAEGYSVWWDTSLLSGENFRKVIMTELGRARAAIVIWTERSIASDWVASEAGRAHADRKLIPVKAKGLAYEDIPPPFDNMHIENVDERDKIAAAVVAQLAKPASSLSAFGQFSKKARFELLSWIGLLGGILTLAAHLQSAITVARWARLLFDSWAGILTYVWGHILFFLPGVYKADAIILTLISLVAVNILVCAGGQHHISNTGRYSRRKWIESAVWTLIIFIVFVAGNPRLTSPSHIAGFIVSTYGGRLVLDGIVWVVNNLVPEKTFGLIESLEIEMWMLWAYLFLCCVIPVIFVYFIVSRMTKTRLSAEVLAYRLSRIVIGLGIIVGLNYLAVWWDRQT